VDLLDLLLIVVSIGFGFSGYRQGFLIGVLSFLGFLGGGVLGAKYAPSLHSAFGGHGNSAVFGLLTVFIAATIGQLTATAIGGYAWERAGLIWYTALRSPQIHPRTSFAGFARVSSRVARRLFGPRSAEALAVREAWHSLGVL